MHTSAIGKERLLEKNDFATEKWLLKYSFQNLIRSQAILITEVSYNIQTFRFHVVSKTSIDSLVTLPAGIAEQR